MDTTPAATAHRVIVDDLKGITACACGLHVFARPAPSRLFDAFIDAHAEIIGH